MDTYKDEKWFQQLVPVRTQCLRCGLDSPIVHTAIGDLMFDSDPRNKREHMLDITDDAISAFAEIGWRFDKYKSYCPTCKGLG
jgi:hypothetical protein